MSRRFPLKPRELCDKSTLWRRDNPERARTVIAAAYTRKRQAPEFVAAERARMNTQNAALKHMVITVYGEHCACCGESNEIFLTIDHVNGGGNAHRKAVTRGQGGAAFYRWLKHEGFPAGYQVLCFNCNFAKHNGGCPHANA